MSDRPDEQIERDVEKIVADTLNEPKSSTYFDPTRGYVTPDDEYESDTYGSLKEITAALKNADSKGVELPDDLFELVEQLLYKYKVFIRQGAHENVSNHKAVSWYLSDFGDQERALISYQDGPRAEWVNDAFADEVPLWLLLSLLRKIQRAKPLGDQAADEAIKAVDNLDTAYVSEQEEKELDAQLGRLKTRRTRWG
jgi:hypothetical protein